MKKVLFLSLVAVWILCAASLVTAQTFTENATGTQGSYTYEYWKDYGTGRMVLGSGGAFSIEWSNIGNLLARKGLRPGSWDNVVTYAANYQPNGNSYLCIYGWTKSPLVEYYIVDSWGSWRPPGGGSMGATVTSDGSTYDIYRTQRDNQPSIEGTASFPQFWSIRQSKKNPTSGTITVGNHFQAWRNKGMNMGNMYEVSFCIEGYQSSGSANVYEMSITSGPGPTPTSVVPTATPDPDANLSVIARGTMGGEILEVHAGGSTVASFTMTTSYQTFTTKADGQIEIHFVNDDNVDNGMDAQVDYIIYNGETYQAEDQATNTAVWQDDSCGGSYSDMMHCGGYIRFDDTGPTITNTPTPITSTPTPVDATPTITPTPVSTYHNGPGSVNFGTNSISATLHHSLDVPVYVNTGNQNIGAYGIDVSYPSSILELDEDKGDEPGVSEGPDDEGFVSAVNHIGDLLKITGFNTDGTGPDSELHLITIHFTAEDTGSGDLEIAVIDLTDADYEEIGDPCGDSVTVTVSEGGGDMMGDVNGDGEIGILDCLMAAQHYVGLNPPGYNPAVGDVNCDGERNMLDALMIAQYYVGTLDDFPSC